MGHINNIYELFVGYSYLNRDTKEMKANASSTLVKGENKTILVSEKIFFSFVESWK